MDASGTFGSRGEGGCIVADENNVIRKTDSIGHTKEILEAHGASLPRGWEIAMGMLLEGCDYLEVCGFGHNAQFRLCEEE